jgi:hypothetical protein
MPTMTIQGVKILEPTLLLDAKCGSITSRANEERKQADAGDIVFLLKYFLKNDIRLNWEHVPNATQPFVRLFSAMYLENSTLIWESTGYKLEREVDELLEWLVPTVVMKGSSISRT